MGQNSQSQSFCFIFQVLRDTAQQVGRKRWNRAVCHSSVSKFLVAISPAPGAWGWRKEPAEPKPSLQSWAWLGWHQQWIWLSPGPAGGGVAFKGFRLCPSLSPLTDWSLTLQTLYIIVKDAPRKSSEPFSDLHCVGRSKAMSFSLHTLPMELAGVKGMTQRESCAVNQLWRNLGDQQISVFCF